MPVFVIDCPSMIEIQALAVTIQGTAQGKRCATDLWRVSHLRAHLAVLGSDTAPVQITFRAGITRRPQTARASDFILGRPPCESLALN
jgi:hypothetical protein